MQCVILVGGLGTRLGTLTSNCPKPMLPVAGKPFIEYLIDNAARFGFRHILLLSGYRADIVRQHFAEAVYSTPTGTVTVEVIAEPKPLGTAGAVNFAADSLESEFLLLNGDSYFDFNWLSLTTPIMSDEMLGRIAVRPVKDAFRYGTVALDATGRVLEILERPNAPGPGIINGGVYWLKRKILNLIRSEGSVSLERDVFPQVVALNALGAKLETGEFFDIGVPEEYAAANVRGVRRHRPAVFLSLDCVVSGAHGDTHPIVPFRWMPGAIKGIRSLNDRGFYTFIVVNQTNEADRRQTARDVYRLHQHMQADLRRYGAHIDDICLFAHYEETKLDISPGCNDQHNSRSMTIQYILTRWPIASDNSVLVGNSQNDIDAALAIGLTPITTDRNMPLESVIFKLKPIRV